jgi:hypothetical protein
MKYTVSEKMSIFITFYVRMFINIFRLSTWSPFLFLAGIQTIFLILITNFNLPGFASLIMPLLKLILPVSLIHYPQYYLAAPMIYSLIDSFILGPSIWLIAVAAAIYKLNESYDGEKISLAQSKNVALSIYSKLLLLWLIQTALMVAIVLIPTWWFSTLLADTPRRSLAAKFMLQMAGFGISAFMIYTIPGIIIGKKSLGKAIGDSIKICFHNLFFSFFVIFLPGIVKLIIDLLATHFAPLIIYNYNPDIILWLLYSEIAIGIFLNLFIYGTATYAYRQFEDQ